MFVSGYFSASLLIEQGLARFCLLLPTSEFILCTLELVQKHSGFSRKY